MDTRGLVAGARVWAAVLEGAVGWELNSWPAKASAVNSIKTRLSSECWITTTFGILCHFRRVDYCILFSTLCYTLLVTNVFRHPSHLFYDDVYDNHPTQKVQQKLVLKTFCLIFLSSIKSSYFLFPLNLYLRRVCSNNSGVSNWISPRLVFSIFFHAICCSSSKYCSALVSGHGVILTLHWWKWVFKHILAFQSAPVKCEVIVIPHLLSACYGSPFTWYHRTSYLYSMFQFWRAFFLVYRSIFWNLLPFFVSVILINCVFPHCFCISFRVAVGLGLELL